MDPYVYPGTEVLKNLRDIRDPLLLNKFEASATARRLRQLERNPLPGAFDAAHLRAIHRHIFRDVFEWAGQFRTVDIAKAGSLFALGRYVAPTVDDALARLAREGYLTWLSKAEFCQRAARYLGEINAIHPFREGNGRTQREFIRELAVRNGHQLNWARVNQDEVYAASRASFRLGGAEGFDDLLAKAIA